MAIMLEASWQAALGEELKQTYFQDLLQFVEARKSAGVTVYPPSEYWFTALNSTPIADVKVVILGQDPYHGSGQAHGLSFSVLPGVKVPPSLRNIYKELQADLGMRIPDHGHLQAWAEQGVLLLNSVFTVEEGAAGSHQRRGWELFTDSIVKVLNEQCQGLVFMLWGSHAQKKGAAIDRCRHLVLEAPHPSPLSAHRGFLGCRHFSKANAYFEAPGRSAVDWRL
ncbi:MAG: uracil-DNA glycosylase [Zhongshania sp.]|jgi:uracil-DNA glycosylase